MTNTLMQLSAGKLSELRQVIAENTLKIQRDCLVGTGVLLSGSRRDFYVEEFLQSIQTIIERQERIVIHHES